VGVKDLTDASPHVAGAHDADLRQVRRSHDSLSLAGCLASIIRPVRPGPGGKAIIEIG
jgi:hypothetical protein